MQTAGKIWILKKLPKNTWSCIVGKNTYDGAGTGWKESQAFAKELNDLDEEFSMEQGTQRVVVLSARSSFFSVWKHLPINPLTQVN